MSPTSGSEWSVSLPISTPFHTPLFFLFLFVFCFTLVGVSSSDEKTFFMSRYLTNFINLRKRVNRPSVCHARRSVSLEKGILATEGYQHSALSAASGKREGYMNPVFINWLISWPCHLLEIQQAVNYYKGSTRNWPSKVVLAVVGIYGNSSSDPLNCSFFKDKIRLASPFSMSTRERPTPNSDFEWPKENIQTVVISLRVETDIGFSCERISMNRTCVHLCIPLLGSMVCGVPGTWI